MKAHPCHFLKRLCCNSIQSWSSFTPIDCYERPQEVEITAYILIPHFWDNAQRNIIGFVKPILSEKASHLKTKFGRLADKCSTKCSWCSYFSKNSVHVNKAYMKATLTHTAIVTLGCAVPSGRANWWSLADNARQQTIPKVQWVQVSSWVRTMLHGAVAM